MSCVYTVVYMYVWAFFAFNAIETGNKAYDFLNLNSIEYLL